MHKCPKPSVIHVDPKLRVRFRERCEAEGTTMKYMVERYIAEALEHWPVRRIRVPDLPAGHPFFLTRSRA